MVNKSTYLQLAPSIGIILFVGLYVYASYLYPGGSQANINSVGFDWFHNYWCNLLNENAMNGIFNPARPFAILAMFILCLSLLLFFLQFAALFVKEKLWKRMIQIGGTISTCLALFIFTKFHDAITILSSFFGFFALVGIVRSIYKSALTRFKQIGILCIILILLNNYIYYSENYLEFLPFLQKLTFGLVLFWVVRLNWFSFKRNKAFNYSQILS